MTDTRSGERCALADALDYFRPHRLTGDAATIILTAGTMRQHLAVIEAALRGDAPAETMRGGEDIGYPDEVADATMAVVDQIEAAAEYAYAPDGAATLTWGARQAIGRLIQGKPMRVELRPDVEATDALGTLPVLDEAIVTNASAVHAEMMSDKQLWIGIDGRNGEHARLIVDAEFERDGSRRFVLRLRGEDEGNPIAEANASRALPTNPEGGA